MITGRTVNRLGPGHTISLEVRYEQTAPNCFFLRQWRINITNGVEVSEGSWHRIHGNQRKPIGSFAVHRNSPPPCE